MNKVERPAFVKPADNRCRHSPTQSNAAFHALSHLQMGLTIDAQHAFDVHVPPVAAKQHRKSTESETTPFRSELFETSAQRAVVLRNPHVANHSPVRLEVTACLTFTDVELFTSRLHDSTLLRRRQKFPEAAIFSASILSA